MAYGDWTRVGCNLRFFGALVGWPDLTWSEHIAKYSLGHYDDQFDRGDSSRLRSILELGFFTSPNTPPRVGIAMLDRLEPAVNLNLEEGTIFVLDIIVKPARDFETETEGFKPPTISFGSPMHRRVKPKTSTSAISP
jgi:hypothetical protein